MLHQNEIYREQVEMLYADGAADCDYSLRQRFLMQAAIYNYLPWIPAVDYPDLIAKQSLKQRHAIMDVNHLEALIPGLRSQNMDLLRQPGVFVAAHTGSYRLLLPFLVYHGHKVMTLIDHHVAASQQEGYESLFRSFVQSAGMPHDSCRFVETRQKDLAIQLFRWLRAGRSVLMFIDGNKGVDGMAPGETVSVPFLGANVLSHMGPARIARAARANLQFVSIKRSRPLTPPNWEVCASPISNAAHSNGKDPEIDHMKQIWRYIGEDVRDEPEGWEALRYAANYIDHETPTRHVRDEPRQVEETAALEFNGHRYQLLEDQGVELLFDRGLAGFRPLSPTLAELLRGAGTSSVKGGSVRDAVGLETLRSLLSKDILTSRV